MLTHLRNPPSTPSRVVILGAAGFLASAIKCRLEAADVPVLALPRTSLDLTCPNSGDRLTELLRSDDSLLFVAAKAPVKNESMLIENLQMGANVSIALRNTPVKHLVYVSSDAVYSDSNLPLTEESCAQPASLHGIMHLAREVMLANCYHGPTCILRPTLIYGAADPHNGYGPNRFCRLASTGETIVLFGAGEERRDHVWVEDAAEVAARVLSHQSIGILNIASGEILSFLDIAEQAKHLCTTPVQIKTVTRIGAMPHNGYRPFNVSATYTAFSDFQYARLKEKMQELIQTLSSIGHPETRSRR